MRIWFTADDAKSIGYVAHRGFDHPKSIDDALDSLDISLISQTHPDKHTTRGLNTFGLDDHRYCVFQFNAWLLIILLIQGL